MVGRVIAQGCEAANRKLAPAHRLGYKSASTCPLVFQAGIILE